MVYCSEPQRAQLFLPPRWASDYRRSPRMAHDAAPGLRNSDAIAKIAEWARAELSDEERAALAKALGGDVAQDIDPDAMQTSSREPARAANALPASKGAAPAREIAGLTQALGGGPSGYSPVKSARDGVDVKGAILSFLRQKEIGDEDLLRVDALLGTPEAVEAISTKGAHDSARRRFYADLRRDGLSAHDARLAADSLARISAGGRPTFPISKAALDTARAARFPSAAAVHVSNHGQPVPFRAVNAKPPSAFSARYPSAGRIKLGG